jgi:RimJ/RimL family protein N-acetyltransferase
MSEIAPKQCTLKTAEKIIIRTAQPDDAQALLDYRRLIITEDLYMVTTPEELDNTIENEIEMIRSYSAHPARIILVAQLDGEIVGAIQLKNSSRKRLSHRGTLHLSVHPSHRRKGIADALIRTLIDWARHNPLIEKLALGVFENNPAAISLYKKHGFIEEGRRIREIRIEPNRYIDNILMYRLVEK